MLKFGLPVLLRSFAAVLLSFLEAQAHTKHVTAQVIEPAFLILGGVALISAIFFYLLPVDAGASLQGRPARSRV